jgi:hypothetical protein
MGQNQRWIVVPDMRRDPRAVNISPQGAPSRDRRGTALRSRTQPDDDPSQRTFRARGAMTSVAQFDHIFASIMPRLVSEGESSTANNATPDRRGHREGSTRRMFRRYRNYISGEFRFGCGVTTPNRCAQPPAVKGRVRTCRSAYHCRCYASESARQSCSRISTMEGGAWRCKRAAPSTRPIAALGRHLLGCARTRVWCYDEGKLIRMAQQRLLAFLSRGVRRKPA